MKFSFKLLEKVKNQTGVSAVIVAIVLTMLIGFSALGVDVGHMYLTRNEL
ncbi:MAG: TadE/TadG family type IV pilus assembly protein, partial [Desulfobacteria bacterium]